MIDAHCHLQDARFAGDVPAVIARARQAGVRRMLCHGTRPDDWERVSDLARTYAEIVPCYGVHPWYAGTLPEDWADNCRAHLVKDHAAVGEIGLDGAIDTVSPERQEAVFRVQLRLARELGRPFAAHCVKAWDRLIAVLREEGPFPAGFYVHAFGGGRDAVRPILDLNGWFSFSAMGVRPEARRAREALTLIAPERLLAETDAPDQWTHACTPACAMDRRNEPAALPAVIAGLARVIGRTPEHMDRQLDDNAAALWPRLAEA